VRAWELVSAFSGILSSKRDDKSPGRSTGSGKSLATGLLAITADINATVLAKRSTTELCSRFVVLCIK
jgi:hypothetical protein